AVALRLTHRVACNDHIKAARILRSCQAFGTKAGLELRPQGAIDQPKTALRIMGTSKCNLVLRVVTEDLIERIESGAVVQVPYLKKDGNHALCPPHSVGDL